jgi:DNA repair protein RadC
MHGLVRANPEDICNCFGMGLSKWAQIQAAYELVKRCLQETLYQGAIFSSPLQVREFLQTKIGRLPHEVFLCLYLDSSNRLIECQELLEGQLTEPQFTQERLLKSP